MRNKCTDFIIFCVVLNGSFFTSATSVLLRNKRWDDTGDMSNMFRGTAGVDYPDLQKIPTTSFRCEEQVYEGGLYADVETKCQVYHVCHDGRKDSFMCGRGTIFNQQILACDYWYSTECENAPSFYYVNSQIGSRYVPETPQYSHQRQPNEERNNYSAGEGRYNQPEYGTSGFNNKDYKKIGNEYPTETSQYQNQRQNANSNLNAKNYQTVHNVPGTSQYAGNFDNGKDQKPCHCWQSSNKTPWSFPAGMLMNGSD